MSTYQTVKDTVRAIQRDGQEATESDVLHAAEVNHDLRPVDVKQAYDNLRARGEIYSYESGGRVVVKVTDDVIA